MLYLNRLLVIFFLFSLSAISLPSLAEKEPLLTHVETGLKRVDEPMLQTEINVLTQTADGVIWAGTNSGVIRYDGHRASRFSPANHDEPLNNPVITGLLADQNNHLWIGTYGGGLSKYSLITGKLTTFHHDPDDEQSLSSDTLWSLASHQTSGIWIGTRKWLNLFNIQTNTNQRFGPALAGQNEIDNNIWTSYDSSEHITWIGTLTDGVYRWDRKHQTVTQFNTDNGLSHNAVRTITADREGNVWIGTDNGITIIDVETNATKHLSTNNTPGLAGNEINQLLRDSSGKIWIGTYGAGLSVMDAESGLFKQFTFSSLELKASHTPTIVYDILEDHRGTLWFATDRGLIKHHRQATNISQFELTNVTNNSTSALYRSEQSGLWLAMGDYLVNTTEHLTVKSTLRVDTQIHQITEDGEGNIWLATHSRGLLKIAPDNQLIADYPIKPDNAERNSEVASLLIPRTVSNTAAKNTRILLGFTRMKGGIGGIAIFDEAQGLIHHQQPKLNIMAMHPLDDSQILLATASAGLWQFDINTLKAHRINNDQSPSLDNLAYFHRLSSGQLLVSTVSQGIAQYDPATQQLSLINPELNTRWITEDKEGQIWAASGNSLVALSPQSLQVERDWDSVLNVNYFSNKAVLATQTGDGILFGTRYGLLYVTTSPNPLVLPTVSSSYLEMQPAPTFSPVKTLLTDFSILNRTVIPEPTKPDSALRQTIQFAEQVTLSHEDYLFSFEFTAPNYEYQDRIGFEYRLKGFDPTWIPATTNSRTASYSNVPPGHYQFSVRAISPWQDQPQPVTQISVVVQPPWWQTIQAKMLWGALIIIGIYAVVAIRTKNLRCRSEQLERGILKRTQELEQKSSTIENLLRQRQFMFTAISHELRTPLTLVLNPLTRLLADSKHSEDKTTLTLIKRNAERLTQLVEQLLWLAKAQQPQPDKQEIIDLKHALIQAQKTFKPLAAERGQTITVAPSVSIRVALLPDALPQIIGNLLSNAIKYAAAHSDITMNCSLKGRRIMISVQDTGPGIPLPLHGSVFDIFNRGQWQASEHIRGSGIGLAVVKAQVEACKGHIHLDPDWHDGCRFLIELPFDESLQASDDKPHQLDALRWQESMPKQSPSETPMTVQPLPPDDPDAPIILFVEDNIDLLSHLMTKYAKDYRCYGAREGKAGLQQALEVVPDIIVSDVMMPGISGFELCHQVKSHELLAHIPVILLTAKSDEDSRLEGWKKLADDYIAKPFTDTILTQRIDNLLAIRRILVQRWSAQLTTDGLTPLLSQTDTDQIMNSVDSEFLTKFDVLIQQQFHRTDLLIGDIASQLAMSERQLQRKLKALTHQKFSDYLRQARLNRAKTLLASGMQAGQVTDDVGFSSQSYFTACFKAEFGLTPKQYQQSTQTG